MADPTVIIEADWPEVVITDGVGDDLAVEAPPSIELILEEVGVQGIAGAGATVYEQIFNAPLDTWVVNHNLGREPAAVELLTLGRVKFEADITHVNGNQLVVSMAAPATGIVRVM